MTDDHSACPFRDRTEACSRRGRAPACPPDAVPEAFARALDLGARALVVPDDWLETLRVARVADLDDDPIQIV